MRSVACIYSMVKCARKCCQVFRALSPHQGFRFGSLRWWWKYRDGERGRVHVGVGVRILFLVAFVVSVVCCVVCVSLFFFSVNFCFSSVFICLLDVFLNVSVVFSLCRKTCLARSMSSFLFFFQFCLLSLSLTSVTVSLLKQGTIIPFFFYLVSCALFSHPGALVMSPSEFWFRSEVLCACCFAGCNLTKKTEFCTHIFPARSFHSAARRMSPYFRTRRRGCCFESFFVASEQLSGLRKVTTSCCAPGAEIFEGVGKAQPQRGGAHSIVSAQPSADNSSAMTSLPYIAVTGAELWNIAKTKKCHLPGVNSDRQRRYWSASWWEGGQQSVRFSIGKFVKQGLTEEVASFAALCAAIAARNEKVPRRMCVS